jgi:subtilisin family serine protease
LATGAASVGFLTLVGVSAAGPQAPLGRQSIFLSTGTVRAVEQHVAASLPHRAGAELRPVAGGRVEVVIEARQGEAGAVKTLVDGAGGRVERMWQNLVQATLPSRAASELAKEAAVAGVRAPMRMVPHAVNGEEVAGSLAPAWHAKGLTGKNVKVAIIDGGFQGLSDRQATGDLPPNIVTQDFCGGRFATADDHGTAVAEIVHEMAPDAQLYLLCVDTEVDLAAAAVFARSQGVQVVNHSAGWYGPDRGDGSGPIGAIVSSARAAGVLWVNSAGNDAQTHWSGTFVSADGDRSHDWAAGDEGNTFVWPNDSEICGVLKWDEWPAGVSDFDLGLSLSETGQRLAMSDDYQTGSQPPYEGLCVTQRSGEDLTVYWAILGYDVRSSPRLDLFTFGDYSLPLQYQTAAGSITVPADSSAALAVGALCWQSRQPEYFTSQGPTIDGRTKPDIMGHDSVSGATYGTFSSCPSGFAGTSASAPEVAGAAALVKQAFPAYGPDQLQQYLQKSALDIGAPGMDSLAGAGELRLPAAPDVVPPTARALVSTGRAGKTVKLLSAIADDEGKVSLVEQVKRNGKVAKTIRPARSVVATSPKTVATPWKAPAKPKGSLQHCVVAIDASGNKSPESCARIVLK